MSNEVKRSTGANPDKNFTNGPFVAKVVNHLDPKRMGALRVELLSYTNAGGQELFPPGQLFTAYYCSPFYGVNDNASNSRNKQYSKAMFKVDCSDLTKNEVVNKIIDIYESKKTEN